MALFQLVIALLFVGAMLSAWARRVSLPYPALLALAGTALALLPQAPRVVLDPRLALALFVAPVLLDAAFDISPRDLKYYWRPIAWLAIGAVVATVATVAVVTRALVPGVPWAVAIALGAIVAPSDASAATAVLRQLRLPHRLIVIIEGESLFNDASALLIYRVAVAAAVTGTFNGWRAIPTLLLAVAGSVILAAVLSRLMLAAISRIEDVATSVIVQFLSTFAVWILADDLGLSGIITVAVYAILLARRAPSLTPARIRIPSYAVWDVAVFVLNVMAFILVGLQVRPILERMNSSSLLRHGLIAAAVCVAVIAVRMVWAGVYTLTARGLRPAAPRGEHAWDQPATWRGTLLVGWCGMRGIVTLAAALALPDGTNGTAAFPDRDLVLFTAFAVVLGTLVLQGLTLRPLLAVLRLEDDGSVDREVWLARARMSRAGLDAIDAGNTGDAADAHASALRHEYALRARHAEHVVETGSHDEADDVMTKRYVGDRRRAQSAERRTLVELRASGTIGDDAFHLVEEALDWADLDVEGMEREA
jgi:monovalent cation/hydrogen antiporter